MIDIYIGYYGSNFIWEDYRNFLEEVVNELGGSQRVDKGEE